MKPDVECIAIIAIMLCTVTGSLFVYCYCRFMDRLTRLMEENQNLMLRNEVLQDDRRMLQDLLTNAENEKSKLKNDYTVTKNSFDSLVKACERRLENEG